MKNYVTVERNNAVTKAKKVAKARKKIEKIVHGYIPEDTMETHDSWYSMVCEIMELFDDGTEIPAWEKKINSIQFAHEVGDHDEIVNKICNIVRDELQALLDDIEETPDRHANDLKEMCNIRKAFRKRGV